MIPSDDIPFDEHMFNFALFVNCDLVMYEEAIHDDHWVKTMEEEILEIEKKKIPKNLLLFQLV